MSDVTAVKSTWDELFGGGSSFSDSAVSERAPVASTTRASEAADRADNWLDTAGLTSNHHGDDGHTSARGVAGSDLSTVFDDAFLDGLVGVRAAQSNDRDDVWNSSTTTKTTSGHDAAGWTTAADISRSRSPFDDDATFPDPTHWTTTMTTAGGVDERARPRPRPQTAGTGADNPFSVTLHAATAAARSALEASVTASYAALP